MHAPSAKGIWLKLTCNHRKQAVLFNLNKISSNVKPGKLCLASDLQFYPMRCLCFINPVCTAVQVFDKKLCFLLSLGVHLSSFLVCGYQQVLFFSHPTFPGVVLGECTLGFVIR